MTSLMKSVMKMIVLVPAFALAGCAVNSYCEGEQKYDAARSLPPLASAEGATVPESPSALKIPPPPENPVPFGQTVKDEDGDDMISCLDKPPEMPPLAKPAEATPAAPADAKPADEPAAKPAETPAQPG